MPWHFVSGESCKYFGENAGTNHNFIAHVLKCTANFT